VVIDTVAPERGYRPDLDGLRAIAVLAVLAYHLDVPWISGGFVGVDVFFVLSGFLITRMIAGELDRGEFSLAHFYERRIRRIVPAFVVMSLATTAAATIFLLPDELQRYGQSLAAAAVSASNIYFFENSGYFDPNGATKPLLHTWSLGVEEQFYIIFPLLLMAIFRWRRDLLTTAVWITFAVSLAVSIVLLKAHPLATFYLLHARAWELLAGAIVALQLIPAPKSVAQSEIARALGLAAILAAAIFYSDATPFPGAAALLPCLGTTAAIWAGPTGGTLGWRILTWRPMVFVGLISYSLYLWHWPLIVFAKMAVLAPLTPLQQLAVAAAAFVLAVLSWRFVEQPFRRRGTQAIPARTIFRAGAAALVSLAGFGGVLIAADGMPSRYSASVLAMAAASADASPWRQECHFNGQRSASFDKTCILGGAVPPQIVVWGDSHGAELSAALGDHAKNLGLSIREVTRSACPPAQGFRSFSGRACAAFNTSILDSLKREAPKTIVLASYSMRWNRDTPEQFWPGIEQTASALRAAGHRVIMVGPVPDIPHGPGIPAAVARWSADGHDPAAFSFKVKSAELAAVEQRLRAIADRAGAVFVPLSPKLCANDRCRAYADGAVLYFDNNHLSMHGAKHIVDTLLAPVIWPPLAKAM
jgi:peptidoglycan/LPS O-acetylase OafA/YrhL